MTYNIVTLESLRKQFRRTPYPRQANSLKAYETGEQPYFVNLIILSVGKKLLERNQEARDRVPTVKLHKAGRKERFVRKMLQDA